MNKKIVFYFIVLIEIGLIFLLIAYYFKEKSRVLGDSIRVSPLKKENLIVEQKDKLKYYWEPKPNTKITEEASFLSYKPTYTINAAGLNERFDYEVNKSPNVYRIITLGDSYTYGLYVDTRDNWPEKLEDKLNNELKCKNIKKFEVINLGVPGYDIQYSVERFRRKGQKYNPDLVVWFILENDFTEINELFRPILIAEMDRMRSSGEYDQRIENGEANPDVKAGVKKFYEKYKVEDLIPIGKKYLEDFTPLYAGKLLTIASGNMHDIYVNILAGYARRRQQTLFNKEIPFLSIDQRVPKDDHPNVAGHEIIARYVFNYLDSNKVINCE